jgi:hypothetical protein
MDDSLIAYVLIVAIAFVLLTLARVWQYRHDKPRRNLIHKHIMEKADESNHGFHLDGHAP